MKTHSTTAKLARNALLAVGIGLAMYATYLTLIPSHKASASARTKPGVGAKTAPVNLAETPLVFAENRGQVDARVAFHLQGRNTAAYFTSQGLTVSFTEPPSNQAGKLHRAAPPARAGSSGAVKRWNLKLDFVGADQAVQPAGKGLAQAEVNYFSGPAENWRTGIRTYSSVVYANLWPGIDLVYSGTANRLKYEFIVRPGADPAQIRLAYRGATAPLGINSQGQLQIATPLGVVRDDKPVSFQKNGKPVETEFVIHQTSGHQEYGFKLGKYDRRKTLVIDPAILVYSGFIGGGGDDEGHGIAVDASGNAYVTGITTSAQATFPETAGPDLTYNGRVDAFVAKINADGSGLAYAGYIGGEGDDAGHSIAVDASGNAYVTGWTTSTQTTFPVLGGPDLSFNGAIDAFVAKVNPAGTALVYCGYLGGDDEDEGLGIAVDGAGKAYLTGLTASSETTFPALVGPGLMFKGAVDAFVAQVKADGTGLDYAGYLGGAGDDQGRGIAVDASGNAYVAGLTTSTETTFPMAGALDASFNGGVDAFVAKINPTGSAMSYSGYFGGSGIDEAYGIAVDGAGNAYITGRTTSTEASFPELVGPGLTFGGAIDAFVAKVNAAGSALVYAGYIGGSGDDEGFSIAVNSLGAAHVTGRTTSSAVTFPEANSFDLTLNGTADSFFAKVNPAGSALVYAGYFGGNGLEEGFGVAINGLRRAYVTGRSTSADGSFTTLVGPGLNFGGAADAFAARIDDDGVIEFEADVAPRPNGSGTIAVSDWVQVGRFSVGLDTPTPGSEVQRADCAPRATLGDGRITVADWVQAGRYSVGLDPLTQAGGPTQLISALPETWKLRGAPRDLQIASQVVTAEQGVVSVPVELVAQGGENGITFSLQYDPAVLSYQGHALGNDVAPGAALFAQTAQAREGRLGFGIALKPGEGHEPGARELVRVKFKVLTPAASATEISIGNGPAALGLADFSASALALRPVTGLVRLGNPPATGESPAQSTGNGNGLSSRLFRRTPSRQR